MREALRRGRWDQSARLLTIALCFASCASAQTKPPASPAASGGPPVARPAPVPKDTVPLAAARDTVKHTGTPGVEMEGITSTIRLERVLSGHLISINGRYKLRATETVFEPGGQIGAHHHAGPGLRFVLAGELTYIQPGRTTVYRAGDWFYESGDTVHTAINRTAGRDTILNVEILPVDWFGTSAMPAPGAR